MSTIREKLIHAMEEDTRQRETAQALRPVLPMPVQLAKLELSLFTLARMAEIFLPAVPAEHRPEMRKAIEDARLVLSNRVQA